MVMFSALQHHSCKWSPNSIKAPTDNTLKSYSCLLQIAQQLFGVFGTDVGQMVQFTSFIQSELNFEILSCCLLSGTQTCMMANTASLLHRNKTFPEVTHSKVAQRPQVFYHNFYFSTHEMFACSFSDWEPEHLKCTSY